MHGDSSADTYESIRDGVGRRNLEVAIDKLRHALENDAVVNVFQETGTAFFGCRDAQNRQLFAVQAGVNGEDALLHVSLLLRCAEEEGDELTQTSAGEWKALSSMLHSIEMARAVVDALLDSAYGRSANFALQQGSESE